MLRPNQIIIMLCLLARVPLEFGVVLGGAISLGSSRLTKASSSSAKESASALFGLSLRCKRKDSHVRCTASVHSKINQLLTHAGALTTGE